MKRSLLITSLLIISLSAVSTEKTKKGLTFGALPAVSFDSDLGFQYGALINFYQYGDASRYPAYNHSLYLEFSTYTKGSSIARIRYDSEQLISKIRTTVDVSYVPDLLSDFYGFNGYQSIYSKELYKTSNHLFYKNQRNMFRAKADFQGFFPNSRMGWVAGYSFYNFHIDSVNNAKLKIEKTDKTLYENYIGWGLISPEEAKGGFINYLKLGLKYDTRDQLACPMSGIFAEAVIQTAPKLINTKNPHTKFSLVYRQYLTLLKDLSFAYRLDYQTTIGRSKVPYYAQPLLVTSYLVAATNQGLGGKVSMRGILRNRVVGDGVAFSNFELRYKLVRFELLKQHFYLGSNLFFDSGLVLKPINISKALENVPILDKAKYFNDYKSGRFHSSAGLGVKVGWNENFVISAEYGCAFNSQDGESGFYVGLNYLF